MSTGRLHLIGLLARAHHRTQRWWVLPRLLVCTVTAFLLILLVALPHAFSEAGLRRAAQEPVKIAQEHPDASRSIHLDWRNEGYRGETIEIARVSYGRAQVAPPPGTTHPPAVGTMLVSPALAEALARDTLLRQRYPDRVVGTIAESGLAGPRQKLAYIGVRRPAADEAAWAGGFVGTSATTPSLPTPVRTGLPFFAACVVVPLLTLTAAALRLGRSRRARLTVSLDLLGVDRRTMTIVAAVDALAAGLLAASVATATWVWGAERLAVSLPLFDGFFAGDLRLSPGTGGGVLAAFVLFCVVVSVARRRAPRSPAARIADVDTAGSGLLLPGCTLFGGVVLMLACRPVADQASIDAAITTLLIGTILATTGIVGMGPRLVRVLADRWERSRRVIVRMAAARAQFRPRALTRVAATTMAVVLCAPLLLSFFPLLSESTAAASRAMTDRFDAATFIARYDEGAVPTSVRAHADVVTLTEVISPDGMSSTSTSCVDAARLGAPTSCGATLPRTLTEMLAASYLVSGGPVAATRQPPTVPKGMSVSHAVLATPHAGIDPESVRSELLRTSSSNTILSLQEIQALKENDSQAYRTATALALGALLAMGTVASVIALAEYVRSGRDSQQMLRILGVPVRSTRMSYVLQTLCMCVPLVLGALGVGTLAAQQFLRLNEASSIRGLVPALACLGIGAVLLPCLLVAAVASALISGRTRP